uniref:Uncharacterized protein n=1 Tax=Varanus komodoensis TaxID=61221 RepID=A0A8D2JJQ7_VARKO
MPLHLLCRAYVYAIHGFLSEILFVAVILGEDWTFRGAASACALPVYGACGLALERLHLGLRGDCCLLTRCTFYMGCIFLWQLGAGCVLSLLGGCPWDFSAYRFSLRGLIALEHSLVWFVGSLLLEKLLISTLLRLRLQPAWRKPRRAPVPRFALKDD